MGHPLKWLGGSEFADQAVLWTDIDGTVTANQSASDFEIVSLFESDGTTPFEGEVLAVTDTGYSTGVAYLDGPNQAFLHHPQINGGAPVLLSDYVEEEFGVILPTAMTVAGSMTFDGTHLWIAGGTMVISLPVAVPTQGDFNLDDQVDAVDLVQWEGDFGINAGSDANNDGDSDGADFLVWQRGIGSGYGPGQGTSFMLDVPAPGATSQASIVPEPSAYVLLLSALGLYCLYGKRKRCQQIVARDYEHDEAISTIDESGIAKSGHCTATAIRQYNGNRGKVENCIVGVHLGYSTPGQQNILANDPGQSALPSRRLGQRSRSPKKKLHPRRGRASKRDRGKPSRKLHWG